jgi:putative hemin transport protein
MKATLSPERTELKERWAGYRLANPKTRIRDAAKALDTSEAELLATGLGETVQLLEGDFRELIKEVGSLGHVMALTRNDHVVHERKGVYKKISFNNHVGLVLGEDIDLRLFLGDWKFGFAVSENDRFSIQFFNSFGEAAHKIYLTEKSDKEAYNALVSKYLAADQDVNLFVNKKIEKVAEPEEPAAFDKAAFQEEWLALKDTHDFFTLLRKYKLSRKQALRNAPEGYAHRIKPESMKLLFDAISESRIADHGICFQSKLHSDPHRPDQQDICNGPLAECDGSRVQPAFAGRRDRRGMGGKEADRGRYCDRH